MATANPISVPEGTEPAPAARDSRWQIFWAVMQMDNPTKRAFADICEERVCEELAESIRALASVEWTDDEKAALRGMVH